MLGQKLEIPSEEGQYTLSLNEIFMLVHVPGYRPGTVATCLFVSVLTGVRTDRKVLTSLCNNEIYMTSTTGGVVILFYVFSTTNGISKTGV